MTFRNQHVTENGAGLGHVLDAELLALQLQCWQLAQAECRTRHMEAVPGLGKLGTIGQFIPAPSDLPSPFCLCMDSEQKQFRRLYFKTSIS